MAILKFRIIALYLLTVAVLTDVSRFSLSGSLNVDKYKTVHMKHRLLLKHNTSRREVSWMSKKDGSPDKIQYQMDECFTKDDGDTYTNKDGVWIFPLTVHDESRFDNRSYILYAISGETFIVRTWSLNDATLSIAVKQGDVVRLSASFNAGSYEIVEDRKMRLLLKYNITSKEVSCLFDKVDYEDEGQYEMEENCSKSNRDTYSKNIGVWIFHLNVLKPGEIKQEYAGENILITEVVQESIFFPRLYHNDQLIAVLRGSDCDVSTNSPFYGRIRCSKEKDNIRTRIEIKNVTENDTGLYTVETEGSLTQRRFLNITGTYTNSASALIIVTTPDRFDGINSDQSKNITLSTTVRSSTVMNLERTHAESELFYILPITTVAVLAIILFFASLIWIQRTNIKSFKAVQRIVQETMETSSSAAFSTLGRSPHTPSREEICTSNSKYLRSTVTNPAGRLQYPTPKVSTSGHISCHNKRQQLDDDYYKLDVTDTILKVSESRSRSNKTLLAECYQWPGSLIDAYPFPSDVFSATESEGLFDRQICNANGQCQVTRNTEAAYAEVKNLSSRKNVKTVASGKDGYEMVEFSQFDDPTNGVEDVEHAFASGTPNPINVGISTSMVNFDPGTKHAEANTIFANVMNHASAENDMSYNETKALSGGKEEQGQEKALSGRKEEQGKEKALSGRKEEQGKEKALSGRKDEQGKQKTFHVIVYNHDDNNPK